MSCQDHVPHESFLPGLREPEGVGPELARLALPLGKAVEEGLDAVARFQQKLPGHFARFLLLLHRQASSVVFRPPVHRVPSQKPRHSGVHSALRDFAVLQNVEEQNGRTKRPAVAAIQPHEASRRFLSRQGHTPRNRHVPQPLLFRDQSLQCGAVEADEFRGHGINSEAASRRASLAVPFRRCGDPEHGRDPLLLADADEATAHTFCEGVRIVPTQVEGSRHAPSIVCFDPRPAIHVQPRVAGALVSVQERDGTVVKRGGSVVAVLELPLDLQLQGKRVHGHLLVAQSRCGLKALRPVEAVPADAGDGVTAVALDEVHPTLLAAEHLQLRPCGTVDASHVLCASEALVPSPSPALEAVLVVAAARSEARHPQQVVQLQRVPPLRVFDELQEPGEVLRRLFGLLVAHGGAGVGQLDAGKALAQLGVRLLVAYHPVVVLLGHLPRRFRGEAPADELDEDLFVRLLARLHAVRLPTVAGSALKAQDVLRLVFEGFGGRVGHHAFPPCQRHGALRMEETGHPRADAHGALAHPPHKVLGDALLASRCLGLRLAQVAEGPCGGAGLAAHHAHQRLASVLGSSHDADACRCVCGV
mmetsp:Transcript_12911/g.47817  ORF Transcript_12911/g.47817 Transcript_12911/m.47817 type:complete len:589 (+) Transcript_12911:824-2590(+)